MGCELLEGNLRNLWTSKEGSQCHYSEEVQVVSVIILLALTVSAQRAKWSEQARDWYAQQPWLIGGNYNPASAIN